MSFKEKHKLYQRKKESKRILNKYPDRIPVVAELSEKSTLPKLSKTKYLVPNELTMGEFKFVIRKRIQIDSELSLFMFVNNTLPTQIATMKELYEQHHDVDGFLYITVSEENTFG